MDTKVCSVCGAEKPLTEFSLRYDRTAIKNARRSKFRRCMCKSCDSERDFYYRIDKKYGVTREQHDRMFDEQGGCCALCRTPQSELPKRLGVDHNHVTGEVRGLLCDPCNRGIGLLYGDNYDSHHLRNRRNK
jgi:hypothetical protein